MSMNYQALFQHCKLTFSYSANKSELSQNELDAKDGKVHGNYFEDSCYIAYVDLYLLRPIWDFVV